jgi:hypothetical protein
MKLLDHVYAVKNLLSSGPSSDDFSYSNRLIAHYLGVARTRVLQQKVNKYHFVSEQSYQDWCVDLEEASYHDCCDIGAVGCPLLRGVIKVPKFLNSRWGSHVKVTDLAGVVIPQTSMSQVRLSGYGLVKPKTGWFLHNNYPYIVNNLNLKKILFNSLFEDPEEIHDLNCATTAANCPEYLDSEFPIDPDLIDAMYRVALEFLTKRTIPDLENNANDDTGIPKRS